MDTNKLYEQVLNENKNYATSSCDIEKYMFNKIAFCFERDLIGDTYDDFLAIKNKYESKNINKDNILQMIEELKPFSYLQYCK